MIHNNLRVAEALLLVHFDVQELVKLSDAERLYLATIGLEDDELLLDDDELPLMDDDDDFSFDAWKEQFISYIQCYEEAKQELASTTKLKMLHHTNLNEGKQSNGNISRKHK